MLLAACGSDGSPQGGHKAVDLTSFISTDVTTTTPSGTTPSGCGDVTADGSCSGDTYTYCDSGKLLTEDCTAAGLSCQLDGNGVASCGSGGGGGSCGSVPDTGQCNGDVLSICVGGQLDVQDCAAFGAQCVDDPFFGADCF